MSSNLWGCRKNNFAASSLKFNHKVMTKTSLKLIFPVLLLALWLPLTAHAFAVKTGSAVNVGQTETVDGNLYAAGSTILIDGQVKGDVICAGQSVTISGKVDGDVLCAAQSINVLGEVTGSVRTAGTNIHLNNKVGRNVMAFGASVTLSSKAEVGLDMLVAAGFVNVNGKVGGSLYGTAGMATINGQVAKDVSLNLDSGNKKQWTNANSNLVITENAKIGGNLNYTSVATATIAQATSIGGKVSRQLPPVIDRKMSQNLFLGLATFWLWCKIIGLFGTLLIALVLVLCFKDKLMGLLDGMVATPKKAIGWGAIWLILMPFILLFLLITVIGLPLACLITLLWLAAMMLGKVIVAIFVGLVVMGRYRHRRPKNGAAKESTGSLLLSALVGVVITTALFTIPLFGWLLAIIAKMWGLGVIWLNGRQCCQIEK